jgi:hypothetical protein
MRRTHAEAPRSPDRLQPGLLKKPREIATIPLLTWRPKSPHRIQLHGVSQLSGKFDCQVFIGWYFRLPSEYSIAARSEYAISCTVEESICSRLPH